MSRENRHMHTITRILQTSRGKENRVDLKLNRSRPEHPVD